MDSMSTPDEILASDPLYHRPGGSDATTAQDCGEIVPLSQDEFSRGLKAGVWESIATEDREGVPVSVHGEKHLLLGGIAVARATADGGHVKLAVRKPLAGADGDWRTGSLYSVSQGLVKMRDAVVVKYPVNTGASVHSALVVDRHSNEETLVKETDLKRQYPGALEHYLQQAEVPSLNTAKMFKI